MGYLWKGNGGITMHTEVGGRLKIERVLSEIISNERLHETVSRKERE
jgi:hypothetical protein